MHTTIVAAIGNSSETNKVQRRRSDGSDGTTAINLNS